MIALGALVGVLWASVSIQQHVLRWRAERLLADIKSIEMGKNTWGDAQRLIYRWGKWGEYRGSCTSDRCSYRIDLNEPLGSFFEYPNRNDGEVKFLIESLLNPVYPIYFLIGGKGGAVVARFEVIHGIIWAKDYDLYVGVLTGIGKNDSYELIASANTI